MDPTKIKEVLAGPMGMTDEQLAAIPDSDIEAIAKALSDDLTDEQVQAVLESDDVVQAMEAGDETALAEHVQKAMKPKGKKDDDDDGDDIKPDDDPDDETGDDDGEGAGDEDEDEGASEADIKAAEQKIADEEKDKGVKPTRTKKGLSEWIQEDDDETMQAIGADDVIAGLLKSFDAVLGERDTEIVSLRKSVSSMSKKIDTMLKAVDEIGKTPAGHKFVPQPYRVVGGPLDETGGGEETDVATITKSVIDAQEVGLVDPIQAITIIRSAERGPASFATVAPEYAEVLKSLEAYRKSHE